MKDRDVTNNDKRSKVALATGILALILALIASVIAISAYNRAGKDLDDVIGDQINMAFSPVRLSVARASAAARLAAINIGQEVNEEWTDAATEVAAVRADLKSAYDSAGAEFNEEWAELEADFNGLEQGLRNGTASALQGLENLITALRIDVQYDD